jgi:hypothetical protein
MYGKMIYMQLATAESHKRVTALSPSKDLS